MWADGWASGNTAPTKTLTGPSTGLSSFPRGLAVRDGLLYVADQNSGAVRVYNASWIAPDTAPTKDLSGKATLLSDGPIGVTFNSAGQMFVIAATAARILVFSAEGPAPTLAISVKRGTGRNLATLQSPNTGSHRRRVARRARPLARSAA